jgi:F-type H+-transporting ATPase subunit b
MRRAVPLALSICLWASAPAALVLAEGDEAAQAEHGEHHHGGPLHLTDIFRSDNYSFWASIVNFTLLVLILGKMGKQPLADFLATRRKAMEAAMQEAAVMKQKAEARYKEYNDRLATLDQELDKLRTDIERAAEEDKKRIVADAEENARRLKRETESLIDQYQRALGNTIRREMVEVAVSSAEARLRQVLTESDQQRLAQDFARELEGEPANARPALSGRPNRAEDQP